MNDVLQHEQAYRGADLIKKMAALPVVVCGCGAVGSNLVDNMVRQGFQKFTVIDFDRVEDHNRHTQVWSRRDVGQLKAAALKNIVHSNMGVAIEAITKRLDTSNVSKLIPAGALVVDGFDNVESRKIITDYCLSKKQLCLHIGLFQDYAEVVWNEVYRVPRDSGALDVCDYPLARNVILFATAVGTEVIIRYLEEKKKESYTITMKDFKVGAYR